MPLYDGLLLLELFDEELDPELADPEVFELFAAALPVPLEVVPGVTRPALEGLESGEVGLETTG